MLDGVFLGVCACVCAGVCAFGLLCVLPCVARALLIDRHSRSTRCRIVLPDSAPATHGLLSGAGT